jgi:hypothetical protein
MPQQLFSDIGPMLLQYKETDAFGKQAMLLDAIATAQRSLKKTPSKEEAKQYYQELSYAAILISWADHLDQELFESLSDFNRIKINLSVDGEIVFEQRSSSYLLAESLPDSNDSSIIWLTLLEGIAQFEKIKPSHLLRALAAYNTALDTNRFNIEHVWNAQQWAAACEAINSAAIKLLKPAQDLSRLALDQLVETLSALSDAKKELILELYNDLVNDLNQAADDDAKEIALNEFVAQCKETLEGKYASVLKAVLTITAIAVSAVLAGTAGFGIGFALGLWTGPGAFFTAVAGASYAALAVVGASGVSAGIAGTLTGIGLFRPSKELVGVKTFADQIGNIIDPTEQLEEPSASSSLGLH